MAVQNNGARRVTQADVARIAGVSQTVVSLVLTGAGLSQHRVGEGTRQRVLDAISVTGYAANPIAQRLAGGRSSIVGVYTYEPVFPHNAADFYHPFLEGLENEAQRSGVDLLLFTSLPAASGGPRFVGDGVSRLRVADGCILLGRHSHPADLAALVSQNFPFAFIGRRVTPGARIPYAGAAYGVATQTLTERLLASGHRRIALVNEYAEHESVEDRSRGYRRAMVGAGLAPVIVEAPKDKISSVIDMFRGQGISAALVASDLARPMRSAAQVGGLRVPTDLSLVRLGDPEIPDPDDGGWTGFTIPRIDMGAEALRIVLRQLNRDPDPRGLQVDLPCVVVDGATTAALSDTARTTNG